MPSATMSNQPFDGLLASFNPAYNFQSCIIRNGHAVAVSVTKDGLSMMPCVFSGGKAVLTPAANANTYNAVILRADGAISNLAATTDSAVKAIVLVRGPATVDAAMLKTVDAAAAAINMTNAKTALATLPVPPIVPVDPATSVLSPA